MVDRLIAVDLDGARFVVRREKDAVRQRAW
jgi:hypothetical protein